MVKEFEWSLVLGCELEWVAMYEKDPSEAIYNALS